VSKLLRHAAIFLFSRTGKQDGQSASFFLLAVDNVPASAHEYDQSGRAYWLLSAFLEEKERKIDGFG
jgi:hypothetical protein